MIWTKKLIEEQGFQIKLNLIYQDNQSTIKSATNGKESSGKRTRHFDIKYVNITDLIKCNEASIKFFPKQGHNSRLFDKSISRYDVFYTERQNYE